MAIKTYLFDLSQLRLRKTDLWPEGLSPAQCWTEAVLPTGCSHSVHGQGISAKTPVSEKTTVLSILTRSVESSKNQVAQNYRAKELRMFHGTFH